MKVILFGLTGLGNFVLEELIKNDVEVISVSTRKEYNPHPYFDVVSINELCSKYLIKCEYDKTFFKESCDIIISATYHKKIDIKKSVFNLAVNMHPSFLPHLRGKNPIDEALKLKEQNLGLSTHYLTDSFDEGEIIFQDRYFFTEKSTKKTISKDLVVLYKKHVNEILKFYETNK